MIAIAEELADQALKLQLITGVDGLENRVTSAHVSEPTPSGDWLRGGELLMTVGLLLPMAAPECRAHRLSLHRITVRNRIDRIAALTGRRLDDWG